MNQHKEVATCKTCGATLPGPHKQSLLDPDGVGDVGHKLDTQSTQSNGEEEFENTLEHIWGAALDWASSDDFQKLPDDERDKSYLTYQKNVIAVALEAHNQAIKEAVDACDEKWKGAIKSASRENVEEISRIAEITLLEKLRDGEDIGDSEIKRLYYYVTAIDAEINARREEK